MSSEGWLDEREQRAWRSFVGSRTRLNAALARELMRDSGLSAADYEILVHALDVLVRHNAHVEVQA